MKVQPLGIVIADKVQPVRHQPALGKEIQHTQSEARVDHHLDPVGSGASFHAAARQSWMGAQLASSSSR